MIGFSEHSDNFLHHFLDLADSLVDARDLYFHLADSFVADPDALAVSALPPSVFLFLLLG